MATPSSGEIGFNHIAQVVYANPSATVSLGDGDVRTLLGIGSGEIGLNSAYSKPSPGNSGTYGPGTYTFYVPAYQYLSVDVAGAGQGGRSGHGCNQTHCGYSPCATNCQGNNDGAPGGYSAFNGVGGHGGSNNTNAGNNINGNIGGGGAGGSPGHGWGQYSHGSDTYGGSGGRVQYTWTKGIDGPAYGTGLTVLVGSGGHGGVGGQGATIGGDGAGDGGNGWVYINWS